MKYLHLLGSNLRRKKLRTSLTLLSIVMAFILFGYLAAIRVGLNAGVDVAGADRLFVRHRVSIAQLLPESYRARMERIPGVARATHATWFGGIYQDPKNFFPQMPVDPEPFLELYPEYILPPDQRRAWLHARTGAIVGRTTADRFGWRIGDRIPIQATIWTKRDGSRTWEFDLVGIYDGAARGTDTTQMFFRYDYFEETRLFGKGQVGWFNVRVRDPEESAEVARRIDAEFANSSYETKAETEKAFLQGWARQIGDIGTIIKAILSAVFFTILLVAGNTMAQSVRERTGELGVLKAMGFTNGQMLGLVLAESCFLSGLGGALGLTAAWGLIGAGDPTQGALAVFYLPHRDLLTGLGLALALGLVTGAMPALQAMRLRIADALRKT
ncbi:MAG: FtsX-like permease family protein [Verrucomicrobia bacterium]|nr:FtsX-like permease family protein [Verrucomicrobiota bacterium]